VIDLTRIFSQIDSNIKGDFKIPQQTEDINTNLGEIIQITVAAFAAIAVIVIIYAGIQYMLSQGDPAKTTTARNTIIYAAIGLAITALAFTIVSFVTGKF
jgi:lysylphosphatidylglycerol synthetase-like protein (DUF2156 family)